MSKLITANKIKNKRKVKTSSLKDRPKRARNVISGVKKAISLKKKTPWRKPKTGKGVVYLSHIPHGFYEDQIKAYFQQFGTITAVSVPKSKTGRAKGYAFVEFSHPEVAKIAAETMDNYLMCNRVIKAKYIPPEEQKPKFFVVAEMARLTHKTGSDKAKMQLKRYRKLKNRKLKINLEAEVVCKLLRKKKTLKSKIEKLGLDYDFDVVEGDLESIVKKKKEINEKRKKSLQVLSNSEESSLESDVELPSAEENESQEIDTTVSVKKRKLIKNKIKQKIGKQILNAVQNSPDVQKKQSKESKKSTKKNKLLKSGQKQNKEAATTPKTKLIEVCKDTPGKDTRATQVSGSERVVMEVDENDGEISFKTPPNVLKKSINRRLSVGNMTPKNKSKFKVTPRRSSLSSLKTNSGKKKLTH